MTRTADAVVEQDADPAEVGLDAARLARIDAHFRRYVDDGRLPGWTILVTRHGRVAHLTTYGRRDVDAGEPVEVDTVFRIYSMTKPITSVAAMMLYERGLFELTDPISKYLPEFAGPRVYTGGSDLKQVTVPATEPIRVWHLLTHTAGLTYGFHRTHPVDAVYRARGYEWSAPAGKDLAGAVADWAEIPLLFQPGAEWNYSVASDVLGRLVEVVSGRALDAFFAEEVLGPLGHDGHRVQRRGGHRPACDPVRSVTVGRDRPQRRPRRRLSRPDLAVRRRRPGQYGDGLPPVHPVPPERR